MNTVRTILNRKNTRKHYNTTLKDKKKKKYRDTH